MVHISNTEHIELMPTQPREQARSERRTDQTRQSSKQRNHNNEKGKVTRAKALTQHRATGKKHSIGPERRQDERKEGWGVQRERTERRAR